MKLRQNYHFSQKTKIGDSSIHGQGRFAVTFIGKGDIVIEAGGAKMSAAQFQKIPEFSGSYLVMPCGDYLVVENEVEFNVSHLNHSCQPNLKFKFPFWVAAKDIGQGEELTTDYRQLGYPSGQRLIMSKCKCGSASCAETI